MPTRALYRGTSSYLSPAENSAPIFVDSDDNELKIQPDGPGSPEFTIPLLESETLSVTQITSTATSVTLNASRGAITTFTQTLAENVDVSFTLTNSEISPSGAVVVVSVGEYAGAGLPTVHVTDQEVGACRITITNLSAAALNASMVINFAVL